MDVFYDFQIFSLQQRGGVSRYFHSLWNEFSARGDVAPELFIGVNQSELNLRPSVRLRGIRFKDPMWPRTRRAVWGANKWLSEQYLKSASASVYHPTYFWLPERLHGKKLVVTVYDLIHELFPEHFDRSDWAYRWRPEAIRRADLILAISHTTKRDLCEHYHVPASKVVVTPLGCSMPAEPDLPPMRRARPYFLFVGDRRGYKNFTVVAEAWRRHDRLRRDFRLVCFGGGPPTAAERAISGDIAFISGDDMALAQAYRSAEALICPAFYEGFGLPLLEAFHFSCPVATSGGGSLREVGADAVAYFDATDADSLAECLLRIVSDTVARREMESRGRRRLADFSWGHCAELTAQAYASVG